RRSPSGNATARRALAVLPAGRLRLFPRERGLFAGVFALETADHPARASPPCNSDVAEIIAEKRGAATRQLILDAHSSVVEERDKRPKLVFQFGSGTRPVGERIHLGEEIQHSAEELIRQIDRNWMHDGHRGTLPCESIPPSRERVHSSPWRATKR